MYKESPDFEITGKVILDRAHFSNVRPMWANENSAKNNNNTI